MRGVGACVVLGLLAPALACLVDYPAQLLRPRAAAGALVSTAKLVHTFAEGDATRYFTVLDIPAASPLRPTQDNAPEVWLLGKNGSFPHAVGSKARIVLFPRCDALLGCVSAAEAVVVAAGDRAVHNVAVSLTAAGALWAIGGLLGEALPLARAWRTDAWPQLSSEGLAADTSTQMFGRRHAGCVELRAGKRGCEYDGRLSLATFGGRTLVYARANTRPEGGGRYVQVAALRQDRAAWGSFEPIDFRPSPEGKSAFGDLRTMASARNSTDVYFGAVNANPVDARTVLGLFPTTAAHKGKARAAILAAVSCDGVHFGSPLALLPASTATRGEVNDHAVDGFVRRGANVYAYAHHGVPGTLAKFCDVKHGRIKPPKSTLVRYTIPADRLRQWTRKQMQQLRAAKLCDVPEQRGKSRR
ncbi:hypothetical protein M885DRAFT_516420 [Pelagophyceae sp. CCMP2097]|nr:hypothetical protein M885DRAFT_516420 [Pelagophyceae sp. CCMP2097]